MWKAILGTSRPPFLILAPLCVSVAVAYAYELNFSINWVDVLLCYLAAILSHASVNMLNEYHDYQSGLDDLTKRTPFSGGSGTLQKHSSNADVVQQVAWILMAITISIGLYFVWMRGVEILLIGLLAVASVFLYTPHINRSSWICLVAPGFGFGIAFILGSFIAITGQKDIGIVLLSIPLFLLANNLLLLNQFPDKSADEQSGRRHLIIRYGEKTGRNMYFFNLTGLVICTGFVIHWFNFDMIGIILLVSPLASLISLYGLNHFLQNKDLAAFTPYLASNVVATLSYPVILTTLLILR